MSLSRYLVVAALVVLLGFGFWVALKARAVHEVQALADNVQAANADCGGCTEGKYVLPEDPQERTAVLAQWQ